MFAAVRRQWWIPCVTTALAFAVAWGILAKSGAPVAAYEGRATLAVDVSIISKYPALPSAEEILAARQSEAFLERAAKASSLSTSTILNEVDIYTVGTTQSQIIVAYRSTDQEAARRGAWTIGRALRDEALSLGSTEISLHKHVISLTTQARDEIAAQEKRDGGGVPRRTADSINATWQMLTTLQQERTILASLESAYSMRGATTTVLSTASRLAEQRLATAALIGFLFGFVIAAFREAFARRAERRS